ncbi:hypothetical protein Nepgr_000913 [Nepenthes gracilis]|uniref:Uncharacterized protein n=1 Tax=Nepenthes gracilis TaxID=150966 RepID=A0AAD3RWJ7_NEPGR|nr:hypothetical protein Nepgr_000913 [Nepenthes gracilis]
MIGKVEKSKRAYRTSCIISATWIKQHISLSSGQGGAFLYRLRQPMNMHLGNAWPFRRPIPSRGSRMLEGKCVGKWTSGIGYGCGDTGGPNTRILGMVERGDPMVVLGALIGTTKGGRRNR